MSVFLSDLAGAAGLAPEPLRPEAGAGPLPTADGPAFAERLADAWPLLQGQGLATVPLGPSLEVITAAQPAPVVDSLVRFALAQGIEPESVAWLLQQPLPAAGPELPPQAAQAGLAQPLEPSVQAAVVGLSDGDAPSVLSIDTSDFEPHPESAEPPPVVLPLWPLWALRERAPMVASVATPAASAPPGFSPLPLPAAGAQGLSTAQSPPSDPEPPPQAAQPGLVQPLEPSVQAAVVGLSDGDAPSVLSIDTSDSEPHPESAEPPPVVLPLWPLWALRERAPMVVSVATPAAPAPAGFSPLPLPAAGAQGLSSTAQSPPSDPEPPPQAAQPGQAQLTRAPTFVTEAVMMGPSKADALPLLGATGAGAAVVKALLVPPNLARPLFTSAVAHPSATTLAGPVEGVSLGAVSAGWGGGATPPAASSAALVLQAPGSEATTHIERQADIAQRLADALGQRILAMVERGQWQVRLTLRPESLGEVDIELKMQGGQLDAQFRAGLALTRELLQDGMPRLRDVLLNLGMDVAELGVSNGSQSKTGGNPTPSPFAHRAGQGTSEAHEGVSGALVPGSPAHRPAEGPGWDVMV
jgi:hypothetical protein